MGTENAQACVPSQTEPQVKLTVVLVPPCSVDARSGRHSHTLHAGSVCVVGQQDGHVTRHYGRLDVGPLPTAIGASVWLGRSRLGARIRSGHAGAVVRSLSDATRAGVEAARDESFGTGDQCLQIELVPLSEPAEDLITGSLPSVGAANVRVRSGTSPAFELRFTSDHDRLA